MERFSEIRPYRDSEVKKVISRLLEDADFLDTVANFVLPRLATFFPALLRFFMKKRLIKQTRAVDTVASMQAVIADYMEKIVNETTTSLTHSGLERLTIGRNYLFISNHRDIVMDPAFVNYVLYHGGHDTLQIAIGDNLLKRPFVSDLMRLNRSFIVKRSARGRELLSSLQLLSEYIHNCIDNESSVWIAQSEGRAKDGIDRTDPALLKMLAMADRKEPLGDVLGRLHIVPVSISYGLDACDLLKAEELCQIEETGSYEKNEDTDMKSIVKGVLGQKGRVHVAFGQELKLNNNDPQIVAKMIDNQILKGYDLSCNNILATEKILELGLIEGNENINELLGKLTIETRDREDFEARLNAVPDNIQLRLLKTYANPLLEISRL